jgi:4-hydroxy-4-methyl-2-oxoglutarate aldolase
MTGTIPPVSAIADVLRLWGRNGWLTPPLFGVVPADSPILGRVRNVQLAAGSSGPGMAPLFEILSADLSGQVMVLAGASAVAGAVWGEILGSAAHQQLAVGVIVDGAVRDQPEMSRLGLPVYSRSQAVVGPNGAAQIVRCDCSVTIESTVIDSADYVAIDATGCVRIRASELAEVLEGAAAYAAGEAQVVEAIRSGVPMLEAYQFKKVAVAALRK